jgi:hypothetical protein
VRFRANLNGISGLFSYSATISLYENVPLSLDTTSKTGPRPVWNQGTTGVAAQTELQRVRAEYKATMQTFASTVGKAPGRF